MSKLELKIGDTTYTGFEVVDIYKSMLVGAGGFVVSVGNAYEEGSELSNIKIGDGVIAEIEGQKVVTGIIDRLPIRYGRKYNWMDIVARDKTSNLVDCCYDFSPNEWKNQTVENIIKNLCKPFGREVTIDPLVSAQANIKIDTYKANEGQVVWEMIAELCRDYTMMAIVYGDGKITLTKATSSRYCNDGIILGTNIDACATDQGNDNRFSSYIVKGHGIGNDNKELSDYISCSGEFADPVVSEIRPMTIFAELPTTIAQCQKRAKWEARLRAGISRSIEYQVPGWAQTNNKIWEINSLTKVKDERLKEDSTKLILSIRYVYKKETGEISKINVVDKDTFNLSDNVINIKSGFDR